MALEGLICNLATEIVLILVVLNGSGVMNIMSDFSTVYIIS